MSEVLSNTSAGLVLRPQLAQTAALMVQLVCSIEQKATDAATAHEALLRTDLGT
jgi:hypothetical protein